MDTNLLQGALVRLTAEDLETFAKAGFVHEGRARDFLYREGQRWDLIIMGILREEWLKMDTG